MRVSAVDLISNNVNVMTLGLRRPSTADKYLAKAIIGLDADEIISKFYAFSLAGDKRFYDYALGTREIAMRVVMNPNYILNEQPSDLRDDLYRTIAASRTGTVLLVLKSGATSVAQIEGQIIKFEVPHFSKIPELQLTLKCEDPIFRAINDVVFEHGSLGLGAAQPYELTDAISTSPHGLFMDLTLQTPGASFTIQDPPGDWKFELAPQGGFFAGDRLRISSEYANRYVTLERSSVVTHIANSLVVGSIWPIVFPGINSFNSNYSGNIHWNEVSFRPAYWGV